MSSYGNPPENPYGQGDQPTTPYGSQPGYGGGDAGGSYPPYGGGGGYGGGYGEGPGGQGPHGTTEKGFFASLFDFSFSTFVTPNVVKFVYILSVIGIGLAAIVWLVMTIAAFTQEQLGGLIFLIGGPIVLLIYLCLIRMTLELYFAIVRMSEDIHHRLR